MSRIEKPYVLVVDDDEATCTLVAAILRRDFTVECATDAPEAIEKLCTSNFAVVVLDLRMPQSDGFAVLDHLKATKPETLRNVLIVTALLTPNQIDRAKSYGICGIVSKPFDVAFRSDPFPFSFWKAAVGNVDRERGVQRARKTRLVAITRADGTGAFIGTALLVKLKLQKYRIPALECAPQTATHFAFHGTNNVENRETLRPGGR